MDYFVTVMRASVLEDPLSPHGLQMVECDRKNVGTLIITIVSVVGVVFQGGGLER